jgi:hypothetical protein
MDRSVEIPKVALVVAVAVPLALLVGIMLVNPLALTSIAFIGVLFIVLAFPLWLRWHHALLICCWNAVFVAFFLPGRPPVWVVLAMLGLGIAVLSRTVSPRSRFLYVRSVTLPLLVLASVVVVTMALRGGIGARALGSEMWGSKRYLTVLGAIIGYFALTSQAVPRSRAQWYTALFFLSGMSALISDLVFMAGPAFYFLFNFVSVDVASNLVLTQYTLRRFTGLAWLAQAGYWFMLLRYGIAGIFDLWRPWRLLLFILLFLTGLLGGFRSSILLLGVLFLTQFWYERLLRTKFFPIAVVSALLVGLFVVGFAERLPLPMQRSLTFLPIKVHPMARQDAQGSLEWRLSMWKVVVHDVPQYLWLGKGYIFSSVDLYLMNESIRRGFFELYEETLVTGNYHNGLLTLVIPFGLPGATAFAWFLFAGWRVLRRNYLYGDADLKNINTFLIAYFAARLVFYLVFYGQFDLDLMVFTGIIGLSISINGGVKSPPLPPPARPQPLAAASSPQPVPA